MAGRGTQELPIRAFPEGLTSIGNKAFFNCSGLATVTFPEGYTEHSSSDEDDYLY